MRYRNIRHLQLFHSSRDHPRSSLPFLVDPDDRQLEHFVPGHEKNVEVFQLALA